MHINPDRLGDEIPPKPEVPVLACGRLDLVLEKPKTARGKAKWVRRWRMWADNAEMIEDVCKLFVDLKADRVLDPFYGAGNFWTVVRPKKLVARDIRIDGFDARTMRTPGAKKAAYKPGSFNVIVLDPPYVSKGGRDTSTIPGMDEAYGMYDAPRTPAEVQQLIEDSMRAALELLAEDGYLMQKTMNYVSSGAIFDSVTYTKNFARSVGLTLVGEFTFSSQNPGPQPLTNLDGSPRTQVHGRNNESKLLVFQKRKPKRTRKAKLSPVAEALVEEQVELANKREQKVTGSNVRANPVMGTNMTTAAAAEIPGVKSRSGKPVPMTKTGRARPLAKGAPTAPPKKLLRKRGA